MENFNELNESIILRESKESTLNKCVNLTQEQKAEALAFFNGKGQSLWSSVDWNRPNDITWDTIKALMDKANQSNSQMKKRMKNLSVGLEDLSEGNDYTVTYQCEDYTLYHLLSHKGACVIASNKVYPPVKNYVPEWVAENNEWLEAQDDDGKSDGAHWCIAMYRTSSHWDDYTENEEHDFYVFCYTGSKGVEDAYRKVCLDIYFDEDSDEESVEFWNGDDDSFDLTYRTSWYREMLEDAVDKLDSSSGMTDSQKKNWKDFMEFFGGVRSKSTSRGFTLYSDTYKGEVYEAYLEFNTGTDYAYKDFDAMLDEFPRRFSDWKVQLKVDVKNWRNVMGRLDEALYGMDGVDFAVYHGAYSDIVVSHPLNAKVEMNTLLNYLMVAMNTIDKASKEERISSSKVWEAVRKIPQLEGWEEMVEDGALEIDRYNRDCFIYVVMSSNDISNKTDKEVFKHIDKYSGDDYIKVTLMCGVQSRDDWTRIMKLKADLSGSNLYGNQNVFHVSYYLRSSIENDIIKPLVRDLDKALSATGIK